MKTCKNCDKAFEEAEFEEYNVCDDCKDILKNTWPDEGDECGICGTEIICSYAKGYEEHHECPECGCGWAYY